MTIGIDKIGFATSPYVLRLEDLAAARDTDPEKLSKGLLLKEQSVAPITEDIVTLAATAADDILTDEDKEAIDMVILATESGIDQSKAAAVFVHGLLDIQPFARSFEMKEACYAATAALDYAKLHVEKFPQSKVWSLPVTLLNTELELLENQHRVLERLLCLSAKILVFYLLTMIMLPKHAMSWIFGVQIMRQLP